MEDKLFLDDTTRGRAAIKATDNILRRAQPYYPYYQIDA
jgi:hypothetical protein